MTDTQLSAYHLAWLDNPDGGGRFARQRDAIRAHDHTCPGLREAWLPRKGGVSCPSDLSECAGDCGVTFFNEGVYMTFGDCVWHWYCPCCFAKATSCPCDDEPTPGAPDA